MNSFSFWEIVKSFENTILLHIIVATLPLEYQKMGKQNFNSGAIYIPSYNYRREHFNFFPSYLRSGSTLIRVNSINTFKQKLLPFIRLLENSFSNIFDPEALKLLLCLRLGFSHLNEHRFWHNFQECLNALCTFSIETENTPHYFL